MLWQSCYWCPDFWTDLNRCWSLKCFFLRKPNQLCPVSRFKSGLRLPGMNKTLPGHDSDPDLGRTWHVAVVQNAWLNSVCFFVGITWNHTNYSLKQTRVLSLEHCQRQDLGAERISRYLGSANGSLHQAPTMAGGVPMETIVFAVFIWFFLFF
jgi:hypothetical protein